MDTALAISEHPKERLTRDERKIELMKCMVPKMGIHYFINEYVFIENATLRQWVPFKLWQFQRPILDALMTYQFNIALKSRQVGLSWLNIAVGAYEMVLEPGTRFAIWSLRETESIDLLSMRLKPMLERLPTWMRPEFEVENNNLLVQKNGGVGLAFSSSSGDGYTNRRVLIDEAALLDLDELLGKVKPTVDNGGYLSAISRANKKDPAGSFAKTFRGAIAGENEWHPTFVPWYAHPQRDQAWFDRINGEIVNRTGSDDQRKEMYPATIEEALQAAVLDKRIPPAWLKRVYFHAAPLTPDEIAFIFPKAAIPSLLKVYRVPVAGGRYVIGADPAEGNPGSDFSAFHVFDARMGFQMASLSQRVDLDYFSDYLIAAATWYNHAKVLVERNNHGHVVIRNLRGNVHLLKGQDKKFGWLTSAVSKARMYEEGTQQIRDQLVTLHDEKSVLQLGDIEGATLRAPKNLPDDDATAVMLALLARILEAGNQMSEDDAPSFTYDRGD